MGKVRSAWTTGAIVSFAWLVASGIPAAAQQLSERSVQTIMDYAWSYTPEKFTPPSGKTIFIDKKKRDKMVVPVGKAREIIMAGRLTAHAQICDLPEDQVRNYHSLMLREQRSKKWTPQQLVYVNQLHLITVMMLVGKLQIVEKDGKKAVAKKAGKTKARTCTTEQRAKVKQLIDTYVKAGPDITASLNAAPVQAGTVRRTGSTPKPAKSGK